MVPLTPATRLGLYEILAPLGGEVGEVCRARDSRLKCDGAQNWNAPEMDRLFEPLMRKS